VYIPMQDGRVVALRVDNGDPLWERRLGSTPNDILALDDVVYVGSNDNYFYAIRTSTGEVAWRWPTGADVIGRPVADERRVYFASLDNVLRGLDRKTGNQRWKRTLPLRPTRGLVAIGDVLMVSGIAPDVNAFRMRDGAPAGHLDGEGELAAAPHVVHGDALPMVVLVTRDIEHGTVVRAMQRAIDPSTSDIAPLPNPIIPPMPVAAPTP
jgi:eukaryotic-like serine/threonine-protein kinase